MWHPGLREEVVDIFSILSTPDIWRGTWSFGLQDDATRARDRERKAPAVAKVAMANAAKKADADARVIALRSEGHSIAAIAMRTGRSAGSVHLILKRAANGEPLDRRYK